ncbi:hypothetical protein [Burkholderia cepacia]|uniref:hypothetical protein n=1 Tax=Burkholderia cepacia TaxID=292 RepID=UPI00158E4BB9|nr:hypothetical protein [Burkholderia cepacia]
MVEDKLKSLGKNELETLRVKYKRKIERATIEHYELSIEIESMKQVLESIKKLQRSRNEESYEDWVADNGYDSDFDEEEFEAWLKEKEKASNYDDVQKTSNQK